MHELALVKNIFEALEEAYPEKIGDIRRIQLSVGLLSNVQPILMQNAFKAFIEEETGYEHIALDMLTLPILIYCDACCQTSEVKQSRFVCSCGKPSRNIVQGEELHISQVEFSK